MKPAWLNTDQVDDICSVSDHISPNFAEYINFWRHNGYWLFDSPEIIREIAKERNIDLRGTTTFYYEAYELECYEEESRWELFVPELSFTTNVITAQQKNMIGFDIVTFSMKNSPECSYLSCNHMAEKLKVNRHCLFDSVEEAITHLKNKTFLACEPGPCRIFAVYTVP